MASNEEATTFDLMWTILFDGNTPITQVTVEYFLVQDNGTAENVMVDIILGSTLNATLRDLTPNSTYNVSVFLENSVGSSDSVSIVVRTLLGIYAGSACTFTVIE